MGLQKNPNNGALIMHNADCEISLPEHYGKLMNECCCYPLAWCHVWISYDKNTGNFTPERANLLNDWTCKNDMKDHHKFGEWYLYRETSTECIYGYWDQRCNSVGECPNLGDPELVPLTNPDTTDCDNDPSDYMGEITWDAVLNTRKHSGFAIDPIAATLNVPSGDYKLVYHSGAYEIFSLDGGAWNFKVYPYCNSSIMNVLSGANAIEAETLSDGLVTKCTVGGEAKVQIWMTDSPLDDNSGSITWKVYKL